MNPFEKLAGGDLPPSQEETRQRILERLDKERLARLALKGVSDGKTISQETSSN